MMKVSIRNIVKSVKETVTNPELRFNYLTALGFHNRMDDETFLKKRWKVRFGKDLNLENPKTFNEKMQWLKLYNRKLEYTTFVDKYEVKKYVASVIGEEYIIPTLGLYGRFSDIDFNKLPDQFVIKCTHDSGSTIVVRDKNRMNKMAVKKKIDRALKKNYYYSSREWPYKNVKPRIIVEKYMEDEGNKLMRDYKFFCFDGKPEIMYISEGLENHATAGISFYDMNMKLIDCKRSDYRQLDYIPEKPKNFGKMKEFSAILSKGIPHLRVDWYEINGKLYFSELTFSTCGGIVPFENDGWDKKLGDMIDLNTVEKGERSGKK